MTELQMPFPGARSRLARSLAAACLALTCAAAAPAWMYPIDPVPLRVLHQRSDLIVVALVNETLKTGASTSAFDSEGTVADLTVLQVLKGQPRCLPLRVPYPANLICPSPPHYPKGERVLAFLMWNDDQEAYFTVGLSYGTKQLGDDALSQYAEAIQELNALDLPGLPDDRPEALREWVVRCIERPATRLEGARDLYNEHAPTTGRRRKPEVEAFGQLSPEHQARLVSVLCSKLEANPASDLQARGNLASLVRHSADRRLTPGLLDVLEAMPPRMSAPTLMRVVAERLGDAELSRLAEGGKLEDGSPVLTGFVLRARELLAAPRPAAGP